jgi:hypothetical protein
MAKNLKLKIQFDIQLKIRVSENSFTRILFLIDKVHEINYLLFFSINVGSQSANKDIIQGLVLGITNIY